MSERMSAFNVLLLVSLIAIFLWLIPTHAQQEAQFRVVITVPPRDGAEVGEEMDVKGTASIPSGNHLWVLVHRTQGFRNVWWPQDEGGINPRTREWSAHVTFGQPRDVGYEFEIAAITVNEQEHLRLQNYRDKAMESGDWRPIRMPPTTSAPKIRVVNKVSHD